MPSPARILTLLLLMAILPGAAAVPAPQEVSVRGPTVDTFTLAAGEAIAYHLFRGPADPITFGVEVLGGGPIDVYLMPRDEFELYRQGLGGSYLVPYSSQSTVSLERTVRDPDLFDLYLVVDNQAGATGADPTGPVTARVTIQDEGPSPSAMAAGILVVGAIVGVLGVVPALARELRERYRARTARKGVTQQLPPPPGGE